MGENAPKFDDDDDDHDVDDGPPITELDIRMIAAGLHDQGRGHILPDMIEAMTGERPPDEDFSPRKMRIRNPEWRKARKKAERKKYKDERRARMTDEEKVKQVGNLQLWKANNPDKLAAAGKRRLDKEKAERRSREFVTVDLEGFNTGKYYTDDRRDYAAELQEGIARGYAETQEGHNANSTNYSRTTSSSARKNGSRNNSRSMDGRRIMASGIAPSTI